MEIKERYVDGIGKIHFLGNVVKFDLFSFAPGEGDKDDKPEPRLVERLVMSPNGFLASYEAMVNMINKLTEAGVLSKADPNEAENTVETETSDINENEVVAETAE